jgi:membrane-associated phospholipid phosphatase
MLRATLAALLLASAAPATAGEPREIFHVSPAVDGAIIGVSALVDLVPHLFSDQYMRLRCPCDTSEVPGFERFVIGYDSDAAARASDVTLWLALLGPPIAGFAALGPSRAFVQDATVFAEAIAVSSAAVTIVKDVVQRPIPRAYANDPEYVQRKGSYRAFYSGHTTLVWTALTDAAWTIRLRYGEQVWPWVLLGVAGTSVAVERVLAGHHFPTDVIAGAAAGFAIGTAVPLLHRSGDAGAATGTSIVPARYGLSFSGRF